MLGNLWEILTNWLTSKLLDKLISYRPRHLVPGTRQVIDSVEEIIEIVEKYDRRGQKRFKRVRKKKRKHN